MVKKDPGNLPDIFVKASAPFEKSAYKDVRIGRGFTTIDAYHIVERMTELFGLCGDGWGFPDNLEFAHDGNNITCTGYVWYKLQDKECRIYAIGDAMVIKGNTAEGKKKAQTNLLSKATSFLGIGLSVYQGKGIDDPYLDREYAQTDQKKTVSNGVAPPPVDMDEAIAADHFDSFPHSYVFDTYTDDKLLKVEEKLNTRGIEFERVGAVFLTREEIPNADKFKRQ